MPDRPSREDVRAAVTAAFTSPHGVQAVRWDEEAPHYRLHNVAADAVMPLVDQSYEAGMVDLTEHLRQELAKVRAQMERADEVWSHSRGDLAEPARAKALDRRAQYEGFLDAFHHAQSMSVGNSDKDTGVAWPGARQSDRDGKGTE